MPVTLYQTRTIRGHAGFDQILIDEARKYFSDSESSVLFGKDTPYVDDPLARAADLRHVHVLPAGAASGATTSDDILVYVRARSDQERILLVDYASPDGHKLGRNRFVMNQWVRLAEDFHEFIRSKYA